MKIAADVHATGFRPSPGRWIIQLRAGKLGATQSARNEHLTISEQGSCVFSACYCKIIGCRPGASSWIVEFGAGQGAAVSRASCDEDFAVWKQGRAVTEACAN